MTVCGIRTTINKLSHKCLLFSPVLVKIKTPTITISCYKYSGKKISILKRKFVDSEQKILESKFARNVIKKLNWENERLFGRIIKTSQQRKNELQMGIVDIGEETLRKFQKSNRSTIAFEGTPTHFVERGYKEIPPLDFLKPKIEKPESSKPPQNHSLKPKVEKILTESVKPEQNEDICVDHHDSNEVVAIHYLANYEAECNSNFTAETLIKSPFENIDIREVLQFPLINPWRTEDAMHSTDKKKPQAMKHDEENSKYKGFPSVTNILNKTMDPDSAAILERWRKQMINKLGEAGFQKYQQDLFDNGKYFHDNLVQFLQGMPTDKLDIRPDNKGHWQSLQAFLPSIHDVHLLESSVAHSFLMYKGVVDCVASYRDRLVVIDWKTSKKQKPTLSSTYDYPLQVAAYLGALNFDPRHKLMVKNALIIVAYEDGTPGHAHFLTTDMCEKYWGQWLKRLYHYWMIIDKNTA